MKFIFSVLLILSIGILSYFLFKEDLSIFKKKNAEDIYFDNDMIIIPAGEFIIGDRKKQKKKYLDTYLIDRFEVTNYKYKRFIDVAGRNVPMNRDKVRLESDDFMYVRLYGWKNGVYPAGMENHPVNYVDWQDADAYCAWVDKKLPAEEEWEKAARGPDGKIWPWGDEFVNELCNTDSSGINGTSPVDFFPSGVSPYGLFDMAGNVWEWCDGWYSEKSEKYFTHDGEREGKLRVIRGGSWDSDSSYSMTYMRLPAAQVLKKRTIGFRCAKSAAINR